MPEVSVLMPVFNAEKGLEKAVRSVFAQTYGDIELICVNDGSTDGSSKLLQRLAAEDDRLTICEQQANRGVGCARALCLERARGDYLLFVDTDDCLEPDAIARCVEAAEAHTADIVSFKLDIRIPRGAQPQLWPDNLSDRFCWDLWDRPFGHRDVPDRLFQLGVGLNNALIRTGFAREAGCGFTWQRIGESIAFMSVALAAAQRIVLINRALIQVNWWHGANLTQVTLNNPKRCYQQLLMAKEKLEALGAYELLERSYVNHTAQAVIAELEAQRSCAAYVEIAEFYQVYGFDALGIIGFPEPYYYEPAVHAKLRRIVLGDIYSEQEQLIIDLQEDNKELSWKNKKLERANERLKYRLNWKNLGRRAVNKANRVFEGIFSRKPDTTAKSAKPAKQTKPAKQAEQTKQTEQTEQAKPAPSADRPPRERRMNASTGHRFASLCDCLIDMDLQLLLSHRQQLAVSVNAHKEGITDCLIYGERAISSSNVVYRALLDRLIRLLRDDSLNGQALVAELEALKTAAQACTEANVKFVFNLEKQQILPSLESTFLASRDDSRIEAELVLAPLGMGRHGWAGGSTSLYGKNGRLPVLKKDDYNMFGESPDVLFTARPYLNSAVRPYGYEECDRFEIMPVASSGFRTVYLPYAFFDTISAFSIQYGYQYTLQPVAWKVAAYSEQILGNFRKFSELEGANAVLLGAPRYDVSSGVNGFRRDELTEKYANRIAGRPTLFWNSHFRTARGSGQQLLQYLEAVLDYFMERPDLVLFWRPHPMMLPTLVDQDVLTQREVDEMLERIGSSGNIIFDESQDYVNAFALSHAMLTDGDSSLPYEYIATGNPVYIHYIYGWAESEVVKRYRNHIPLLYYRSSNIEGMIARLDAFARGEDPAKEDRMEKAARFIYQNDGHTGERVRDYVVAEMFRDEAALAARVVYPAGTGLKMREGLLIRSEDGREVCEARVTRETQETQEAQETQGLPTSMATPLFYEAFPGDRLVLTDDSYVFSVAQYAVETKPRWVSTSEPAPDQSWTVFQPEAKGLAFGREPHGFSEHVYFRVSMRRADGAAVTWEDVAAAAGVLRFDALPRTQAPAKQWLSDEIGRVAGRVQDMRKPGEFVCALLSDPHHTVNGTWGDTVRALQGVHEQTGISRVVCLGNFTDGLVTVDALREYVGAMLGDIKGIGVPVNAVLGTCDSNSTHNNPEPLSLLEQSQLYLERQQPHYYVDVPRGHLRLVFLDSYDPSCEQPFGYSDDCVEWLRHTLAETPRARKIIVFSHMPPVARLQRSAATLRGEHALMELLNAHAHQILAFISGHNHADVIDNEEAFPIVSIASAKCEISVEGKPEGFVTPERELNRAEQECWDIMLVDALEDRIRFVRFGAGRDRIVEKGRVRWV
jgi:glycosyltransferase involved in cell wall biosynthesis